MTESMQGGNYAVLWGKKNHVDATLMICLHLLLIVDGGLCLFFDSELIDLKALPPHRGYLQRKQARDQGVYAPLPETAAVQLKHRNRCS